DPTNTGINYYYNKEVFYSRFSADMDTLIYSTYLGGGKGDWLYGMYVSEDESMHILGHTGQWVDDFPITSNAIQKEDRSGDLFITKFCPESNEVDFSTLLGSDYNDWEMGVFFANDSMVVLAGPQMESFPITPGAPQPSINGTYSDIVVVRLDTRMSLGTDSIFPAYQEACKNSNNLKSIQGEPGMTTMYLRNGVPDYVNLIPNYQWQFSTDSITWYDLPDARNYFIQPQATTQTTWFRRTTRSCELGLSYSNVAKLFIRTDHAPQIHIEPLVYLCPDGEIELGGSPTASGGQPPYTYSWSPAEGLDDTTLANPTLSFDGGLAIYKLKVEDAAGCSQIRAGKIAELEARASEDATICPGFDVLVEVDGYNDPNVGYHWTALGGSGPSSIHFPDSVLTLVSPTVSTTYQVLVDDGRSSGGNCPTDDVEITVVSPPEADAGPDQRICEGENVPLGTPGDPDLLYVWTPGNHISPAIGDQPVYDGYFPVNEPGNKMTYILTVFRENALCMAASDTVDVFVSFANAGIDGCGPRKIGQPDITGGNAQFLWEVLDGDSSSIAGQETQAEILVNPQEETQYRLTVTINGASCSAEVYVPVCGCLQPGGAFSIPVDCHTGTQVLPFKLSPSNINPNLYDYEWISGDLSALNDRFSPTPSIIHPLSGSTVFTLKATHKLDTTMVCYGIIAVDILTASPPIALVSEDVAVCPDNASTVFLGAAPIPGYKYTWSPSTGLSAHNVANPSVYPDQVGAVTYTLVVEDISNGCTDTAKVTVEVREAVAYVGPDRSYCGIGYFQLGGPPKPHMIYQWEPTQVVTDSTSSQPMVTIYPGIEQVSLYVLDTITGCDDDAIVFFEELDPVDAYAGEDTTICRLEGEAMIGDPNFDPALSYVWFPTEGLDDPSSGYTAAHPSQTTTYTLIVSHYGSQGCDAEDQVTVYVNPPDALSLSLDSQFTICKWDDVLIGPAPVSGYDYAWSPEDDLSDPWSAQTYAEPGSAMAQYTLTVTDVEGCRQGEATVTVEWYELGSPGQTSHTICEGDSVMIGMAPIPGASYNWYPDPALANDTLPQTYAKPDESTLFYLEVEMFGCYEEFEFQVHVVPPPEADAGSDITSCGSPAIIGSTALPGFAYSWTPGTGLQNPLSSSTAANPSDTTHYILTVTNIAYGCKNRDTVLVYPVPVAEAGADRSLCLGEATLLGS
ncbi:MAG TPA: hypothetical protein P5248_04790, partial [Bacteroidales bacterium]|nr:hypothetical protein [Bacteroidales bacterium]